MIEVKKPPRWGRPPIEKSAVRSERIVTFLTPGEREKLVSYAEDLGQSISATAYHLIIGAMENEFGQSRKDVQRSNK